MQGPLLIAETPNAGEIGHRYLVPAGIQLSSRLAASLVDRLTGEGRLVGPTYLAIRRKAMQEYSGRVGWETLQVAGVDTAKLSSDEQEAILGRLEHWLDQVVPAAQAINWSRQSQLVAGSEALRHWQNQDFEALPAADLVTQAESVVSPVNGGKPNHPLSTPVLTLLAVACAFMLLAGVGGYLFWPDPEQEPVCIPKIPPQPATKKPPAELTTGMPIAPLPIDETTPIGELVNATTTLEKYVAKSPESADSAEVGGQLADLRMRYNDLNTRPPDKLLNDLKYVDDLLKVVEEKRERAIQTRKNRVIDQTESLRIQVKSLKREPPRPDYAAVVKRKLNTLEESFAQDKVLLSLPSDEFQKQQRQEWMSFKKTIEVRIHEWNWDKYLIEVNHLANQWKYKEALTTEIVLHGWSAWG